MTRLLFIILLIGTATSSADTLTVIVKNIRVGKGNVIADVFDSKKTFFKKPIVSQWANADNDTLILVFDIPKGTYAMAAYQDLNNNKVLDRGFFNIPKEPYGLSNNFRPHFRAPTFDDCKFVFDQQTSITILLK